MTNLPDWLVERVALDEVPPASRERIDRADPRELAERVAALRAENDAELAAYPAGPAVAQIEARVATAKQRRRQRRLAWLAAASTAVAAAAVLLVVTKHPAPETRGVDTDAGPENTRPKGLPRLVAFRQAGDHAEQLAADSLVHAGDLIQLRYKPVRARYGVIASLDGNGVVTLHFPSREDAPAAATALVPMPTSLPTAYALDDAPSFERFFFITADHPLDVAHSLAAVRALAGRADAADAPLALPAGLQQWSLRLRKPESQSPTP